MSPKIGPYTSLKKYLFQNGIITQKGAPFTRILFWGEYPHPTPTPGGAGPGVLEQKVVKKGCGHKINYVRKLASGSGEGVRQKVARI